jgi:hypothetical protein
MSRDAIGRFTPKSQSQTPDPQGFLLAISGGVDLRLAIGRSAVIR